MISNCKLVSVIFTFLFAANYCNSSALLRPKYNQVSSIIDPQLKRLVACLISAGVDGNKIDTREHTGTNDYIELNFQWNTLNGYIQPLVYLVATDVSDIQKAVVCSRLTKVRIVPRSGGHSYVKNGFGDSRSLVVDLAKLNQISIDSAQRTCDISPGARNGLISSTLWDKGFLIAQGICPSVGVGGLALGGGYGHFSRLLGLTSDNIIEVEMVDAQGKLLVANNTTNSDLFWALRGGGGGNFGIVSKFKFNLYDAPKSIPYGSYEYSFEDFELFYNAWQCLTSDVPNNIFSILEIEQNLIKMTLFAFNGANLENVSVSSLKKLYNSFPFPVATSEKVQLLSYEEFLLVEGQTYTSTLLTHPSQLAMLTKHNHVGWKKVKSIYIETILKKDKITKLKRLLSVYLRYAGLNMEFFGGAIDKLTPSDTSFVHRDKLYLIQLRPMNSQGERQNDNADSAMKTFYEDSKAIFHHRESYQNYLDQDIPDYLTRYYGTNLKKLIQVKKRFDPQNVFYNRESIPVSY